MQPVTPLVAPASVVEPLWLFFRREDRWPSRKEFLLMAEEKRLPIEPDGYYSNLAIGRAAQDQVRPSFLAIIALREVRELLSPLPALLRQAAAVFVTKAPGCSDNTLPTLHFREVRSLWAQRRMRARLYT